MILNVGGVNMRECEAQSKFAYKEDAKVESGAGNLWPRSGDSGAVRELCRRGFDVFCDLRMLRPFSHIQAFRLS